MADPLGGAVARLATTSVFSALLLLAGCTTAVVPARPAAVSPAQVAVARAAWVPTSANGALPGQPVLHAGGVYIPSLADLHATVPVLVALHGMGGSDMAIVERMRSCAEMQGWVLFAPSLAYRDYLDAEQVRLDGQQNIPRLHALLAAIRDQAMPLHLADRILLYGFSRGAQTAHRYALFYPDEVAAVAVLSAGSFTLPDTSAAVGAFPFGIQDLQTYTGRSFDDATFARIPFWVGVGGVDTVATDTARAWDAVEGATRVDRARTFSQRLRARGVTVSFETFAGVGHEETAAMRTSACHFLADHVPTPPVSVKPSGPSTP